ncbi:MAG TPA: hypothetical protein DEB39_15685 [Planctomycetaceae bacterium]|nr:hypothetical protein [Planctomycetaceae bacterium]
MKKLHCFILFFSLTAFLGCGGKYPLTGKVTFSDDGSPIPECIVFFVKDTFLAQGNVIKADGTYLVGSTGLKDGLPPGEYQVYIAGAQNVTTTPQGENIYTSQIDDKYRSVETSGLAFTVDGKKRRFDIQLDRAPQTGK